MSMTGEDTSPVDASAKLSMRGMTPVMPFGLIEFVDQGFIHRNSQIQIFSSQ